MALPTLRTPPSCVYLPISDVIQEKVIAERESALLKEQELYNRLRNKDYGPAIALALELKRPQKLWGVLRDAMTEGMGEGVAGADDEGKSVALKKAFYLLCVPSKEDYIMRSSGALFARGCRTSCAAILIAYRVPNRRLKLVPRSCQEVPKPAHVSAPTYPRTGGFVVEITECSGR